MESSIRSCWNDQVKFFKPETVFRKDNVHIRSDPYYHLGWGCVLLSYPVEDDWKKGHL